MQNIAATIDVAIQRSVNLFHARTKQQAESLLLSSIKKVKQEKKRVKLNQGQLFPPFLFTCT